MEGILQRPLRIETSGQPEGFQGPLASPRQAQLPSRTELPRLPPILLQLGLDFGLRCCHRISQFGQKPPSPMRRQRHRSSRSLARAPYPPPPAARPRGPLPRWTEPGGSPGRNPLPERFDPAWLCLRPPLRVRRDRGPTTTPPEKPEAPVRKARGRGQWVEPQRRPSTASPFPEHGTQRLRAGRPAGTRGPADCTSGGGSRASGQARIAPVRHFRLRPGERGRRGWRRAVVAVGIRAAPGSPPCAHPFAPLG